MDAVLVLCSGLPRRTNATLAIFNNKLDMSIPNYHGSQDTLWEEFRIDKVLTHMYSLVDHGSPACLRVS
jgi:hypothetical protein